MSIAFFMFYEKHVPTLAFISLGILIVWLLAATFLQGHQKSVNILGFIGFFVDIFFVIYALFIFPSYITMLLAIGNLVLNATITYGIWIGSISAFTSIVLYFLSYFLNDLKFEFLAYQAILIVVPILSVVFGVLYIHQKTIVEKTQEENKLLSLSMLYDMVFELNSSLNYEYVLESALMLGLKAMTGDEKERSRILNAFYLEDEIEPDKFIPKMAQGLVTADYRVAFTCEQGALQKLRDNNDLIVIKNPQNDPELKRLIAIQNMNAAVIFPLRYRRRFLGFMIFAHPNEDFFNNDRLAVLNIILRQAVSSLQNAMLYEQIQIEKNRLRDVHNEAQKKLARDLHDGPTQSLAAISMRVNLSRRLLEKDVNAAAEELFKTENLARRTTKEMRHMLFTLRPLVLESKGLEAALVALAEKTEEMYNQKVNIFVEEGILTDLEVGKQNVLFYIIDEAINNARKHAKAENINVSFSRQGSDIIKVQIADDGVGFDVEEMQSKYEDRESSSLGMVNLRERTEILNGIFHINSQINVGTTVEVLVPITEEAAERLQKSY
jgi:signal transduction histidine kinase